MPKVGVSLTPRLDNLSPFFLKKLLIEIFGNIGLKGTWVFTLLKWELFIVFYGPKFKFSLCQRLVNLVGIGSAVNAEHLQDLMRPVSLNYFFIVV